MDCRKVKTKFLTLFIFLSLTLRNVNLISSIYNIRSLLSLVCISICSLMCKKPQSTCDSLYVAYYMQKIHTRSQMGLNSNHGEEIRHSPDSSQNNIVYVIFMLCIPLYALSTVFTLCYALYK